jgi:TonB family protein
MRGWLIESGAKTHLSPVALATSVTVWTLSFAIVTADRAATEKAVAAGNATAETIRYLQPPLPAAHTDPLGGLGWHSGSGPVAAPSQTGASRGGHNPKGAVRPSAPLPADMPPGDGGTVYIESDVDSPVVRDPASDAPAYPQYLEEIHVEGFVVAEYVVDTTGRADSASLHIDVSSHPAFSEAVRAALPGMHFVPATLNGHKVRQHVRQEFLFQLSPTPAPTRTTT